MDPVIPPHLCAGSQVFNYMTKNWEQNNSLCQLKKSS